jgi:hypothetical protein
MTGTVRICRHVEILDRKCKENVSTINTEYTSNTIFKNYNERNSPDVVTYKFLTGNAKLYTE